MNNIYAVIMAGGSGERFWPKSRRNLPKQLLPIISKKSMIEETIGRIKGLIPKSRIFIVTNKVQERLVREKTKCKNVISEVVSKNTAPCIAVAARIIAKRDPSAVMIVLPSDQWIDDVKKFKKTLEYASGIATRDNVLVTIGMKPGFPHTGYGYIEKGVKLGKNIYKIKKFTEKPDLNTAKRYVKSGRYLWNGGTFIWKANIILEEIKKHLPKLYKLCAAESINGIYKKAENISIDYGVMEKTNRGVVLESGLNWDDVGSWASLDKHVSKDKYGNVMRGKGIIRDVCNSTLISDSPLIAAVGVSDLIIVAAKDAVLVCPKNKAEEVKHIVGMLKGDKRYRGYL